MARVAPRVYVRTEDVQRLETLAAELPSNRHVELRMQDGTRLRGIVELRPGIQVFFDPEGREGLNALLRLETPRQEGAHDPWGIHDIWLDEISEVTRLPNPSPPQASDRVSPPDPNAPTVE